MDNYEIVGTPVRLKLHPHILSWPCKDKDGHRFQYWTLFPNPDIAEEALRAILENGTWFDG